MRISDWSSDVCSSYLHDQVSPVPFEEIEPILAASWGADWRGEFTQFDEQPLASASVAQTYSASLLDGADVIIKVRRPGTAARMEADVRLLTRLAAVAEERSPEIARYRPVEDRKSAGEGKSGSVRVTLGGRRRIKKKKKNSKHT